MKNILAPKKSITQHSITSSQTISHQVELRVQSGIIELDNLLNGFAAKTLTYLQGNKAFLLQLTNQLCVHTYKTFKSSTLFIDAGSCLDPYHIARYARKHEEDSRNLLNHTLINRTFTLYQLQAFILNDLESQLEQHGPRTLILGGFPSLFSDSDIPLNERICILHTILYKLKLLTKHYDLITILTSKTIAHCNTKIRTQIEDCCNETIRIKRIDNCTYIDAIKKKQGTVILHLGSGQLRLEHFGAVV